RDRLLLAWFGPRGLNFLLLILLPVFAGIPGTQSLFALCSLVLLLSVVVHGSAPMFLLVRQKKRLHSSPPDSIPPASGATGTRQSKQTIPIPVLQPPLEQQNSTIDSQVAT